MKDTEKHLKMLGLTLSASWAEVRNNYRNLMKAWHPDRFPHEEELRIQAEARSKDLNIAFRALYKHFHRENQTGFASGLPPTHFWENPDFVSSPANPTYGVRKSVNTEAPGEVLQDTAVEFEAISSEAPEIKIPKAKRQKLKRRQRSNFKDLFGACTSLSLICLLLAAIGLPQGKTFSDSLLKQFTNPRLIETAKPSLIPSSLSCNVQAMDKLLKTGADVNAISPEGDSVLSLTVKNSCLEGTRLLLRYGANPNVPSRNGFNSLEWAHWSRNYQAATLLDRRSIRAKLGPLEK